MNIILRGIYMLIALSCLSSCTTEKRWDHDVIYKRVYFGNTIYILKSDECVRFNAERDGDLFAEAIIEPDNLERVVFTYETDNQHGPIEWCAVYRSKTKPVLIARSFLNRQTSVFTMILNHKNAAYNMF